MTVTFGPDGTVPVIIFAGLELSTTVDVTTDRACTFDDRNVTIVQLDGPIVTIGACVFTNGFFAAW